MDLFTDAINFASNRHYGQVRKISGLPYIIHPLDVMNTLVHAGYWNHYQLLVAAILHDVVEDCGVSLSTIKDMYGETISQYIRDVTKSNDTYRGNTREDKWRFYLNYLKGCPDESKAIKIADRICNLNDYINLWTMLSPEKRDFVFITYTSEAVGLLKMVEKQRLLITPLYNLKVDLEQTIRKIRLGC